MRNLCQKLRPPIVVGLVACMMGVSPLAARGEEHKTNACGCYQNTAGECICTRKSKCDCPGECEPKGCDEKRQKEIDKEIKEETQKAEAAEKKRREEAAAKQRKEEAQAAEQEDSEAPSDTVTAQKDEKGSTEGKGKRKGAKSKKDEKPHLATP